MFFTILWNEMDAAGCTDVLPVEWFDNTGHCNGLLHDVIGLRGGIRRAQFDLTVRNKHAKFNYEKYDHFNSTQGMLIGVMKLEFIDDSRSQVHQVLWKWKNKTEFVKVDVTCVVAYDDLDTNVEPVANEGRAQIVRHLRRERDHSLAARKKQKVLTTTGRLSCEACGFDFAQTYGSIGIGFAEVHHRRPLAEGEREVGLDGLAILCSNCHRMIHQTIPIQPVDQFANCLRRGE